MIIKEERIEKALSESRFSNPEHKRNLWNRLNQKGNQLSEEDLEMAAGGVVYISELKYWSEKDDDIISD
ncbi:MAG: hypothetical protein IJH95_06495 [Mogibacterium sp.]|nr:hypothetical protein [Mogibacterium sp.]